MTAKTVPKPRARPGSPEANGIARDLLAWYDRHRRALPWRALPGERSDPYAVWLSEIMLQQTTVQAVKPFYARFLSRWPTVQALAAAPTDAVMQAWAGLGYYSRARNLHACAIAVVRDHGGRFPDDEAALRSLPGIGAYTAAAIAAIAFGRHAVVVDGNVERVMARLHAVETPLPRSKPVLTTLMGEATPPRRTGDFAQAVMDLGATICTPRSPACAICPLRERCAAAAAGLQGELPRRQAKRQDRMRHGTAYVITDEAGRLLLRTRPPKGLLGGMVELPGTDWTPVAAPPVPDPVEAGQRYAGRLIHVFTHFTLLLDIVIAPPGSRGAWLAEGAPPRWVAAADVASEALPTLMRNALALARSPPCPTPDADQSSRSEPWVS